MKLHLVINFKKFLTGICSLKTGNRRAGKSYRKWSCPSRRCSRSAQRIKREITTSQWRIRNEKSKRVFVSAFEQGRIRPLGTPGIFPACRWWFVLDLKKKCFPRMELRWGHKSVKAASKVIMLSGSTVIREYCRPINYK